MTVELSTTPRGASRETQALITEIYAVRRKFNAAVMRRDQAAGRVDALRLAERKAQRWLLPCPHFDKPGATRRWMSPA